VLEDSKEKEEKLDLEDTKETEVLQERMVKTEKED